VVWLISRAARRELLGLLPPEWVRERPVVRGRTVWGDVGDASVLIDQPNRLGYLEVVPEGSIVVRNLPGAPVPQGVRLAHDAGNEPPDSAAFARRTSLARRLAGTLRQNPGVRVLGPIESPRFTVLLPIDPGPVVAALAAHASVGCDPLGATLPEYPGGLALEVAAGSGPEDAADLAALLAATLRDGVERPQPGWRDD
jgi:hypothetical protein